MMRPAQAPPVTAVTWVSHLSQLVDRAVIQPHVALAGDILGARAVPCAAGPLIGVAWAIADVPSCARESAAALLQLVRGSAGGAPGRYAAWCMLDCAARVVPHRAFRDEVERALPALVANEMPLCAVADPAVIDVDDDTVDVARARARLERRCFRRLYLELLGGWIRDPWWAAPPRDLVEHVLLALCGLGRGGGGLAGGRPGGAPRPLTSGGGGARSAASASSRPGASSSGGGGGAAADITQFAPAFFVKLEEGSHSHSHSGGASRGPAAVKREGDAAGAAGRTLPKETLAKLASEIMAATATAAAARSGPAAAAPGAASGSGAARGARGYAAVVAGDALEETRRDVARIISDLQHVDAASSAPSGAAGSGPSGFARCVHCATLFPNAYARDEHARSVHQPRPAPPEQQQAGQALLLNRLPPPTAAEFIAYVGDPESGPPAQLYATDAEVQELQRARQQRIAQQQQQQSAPGMGGAGARGVPGARAGGSLSASSVAERLMNRFATAQSRQLAAASSGEHLVLVSDPLVKRACHKCAKAFVPATHSGVGGGWFLVDCVETLGPDGEVALAHRGCIVV